MESEVLNKILIELQEINRVMQDMYAASEAQHELLMNKLTVIENIQVNVKEKLNSIENNTKH